MKISAGAINNVKVVLVNNLNDTLKKLGLSIDWDREVTTCLPEYYKWTQYFFIQMFKIKQVMILNLIQYQLLLF